MKDPLLESLESGKPQNVKVPQAREVLTSEQTEAGKPAASEPVAPLTPVDRVQGPNDRANREPTAAEIELGEREAQRLAIEQGNSDLEFVPATSDPEIDPNAPKDVPADPKKVAESRGQIVPKVKE